MIRSIPDLLRFAATASRPGDVAFKVTALLVLTPVIVLIVIGDGVEWVMRGRR